jgi:ABC-2 type transport system ATP-binding protein
VVAEGTPAQLKARLGTSTLVVHLHDGMTEAKAIAAVAPFAAAPPAVRQNELVVQLRDLDQTAEIIAALARVGGNLDQIHIAKASMDDVFFELTGRNRGQEGVAA